MEFVTGLLLCFTLFRPLMPPKELLTLCRFSNISSIAGNKPGPWGNVKDVKLISEQSERRGAKGGYKHNRLEQTIILASEHPCSKHPCSGEPSLPLKQRKASLTG